MTDPTRRPFQFPISHIPYLEKHRIFELFHEIARELVIRKPEDHVLFTKQILQNAASSRDVSRFILLHVPRVNTKAIADAISQVTGQVVISDINLSDCLGKSPETAPSNEIAKCLAYLVRKDNCYKLGWIMVDCIRNQADAKELLHLGILPTHVIHLIAPFNPKLSDLVYCDVPADWPSYRRDIGGIRNTFKATLKEVYINEKELNNIVTECIELSKIRKAVKPIKPRVLLIGPRGSGRKTQANLLAQAINIVYIDFEYLICQAWKSATDIGAQLRQCKNEVCFHSELLSQVVNKRILQEDCLRKGWVLTGYPYTETDFRYLDSLDTPPNQVIFLEMDLNVCRERIKYRQINIYTGSSNNIQEHPNITDTKPLKPHPKDNIDMLNAELNYYCRNYGSLRKYCGATATVVNGDQNERWVHECICAIILRAPPQCAPRKGLSDIDTSSTDSTDCDCVSIPSTVLDAFVLKT